MFSVAILSRISQISLHSLISCTYLMLVHYLPLLIEIFETLSIVLLTEALEKEKSKGGGKKQRGGRTLKVILSFISAQIWDLILLQFVIICIHKASSLNVLRSWAVCKLFVLWFCGTGHCLDFLEEQHEQWCKLCLCFCWQLGRYKIYLLILNVFA